MASSEYYSNEMSRYSNEINRLKKILREYVDYEMDLENLINSLGGSSSNMISASNSFTNGGYVSDGEGLDKGELNKNAKKMDDTVSDLNDILKKTRTKRNSIRSELDRAQSNYNNAKSNYNSALAQERNTGG